jgi:hypothetical protein
VEKACNCLHQYGAHRVEKRVLRVEQAQMKLLIYAVIFGPLMDGIGTCTTPVTQGFSEGARSCVDFIEVTVGTEASASEVDDPILPFRFILRPRGRSLHALREPIS